MIVKRVVPPHKGAQATYGISIAGIIDKEKFDFGTSK